MVNIKIISERINSIEDFITDNSLESDNIIKLLWIGQAGFILKFKEKLIVIDPYLSDYLAQKYKNSIFPHKRLIKIPIHPKKITNLDFIFSTHAHTDHMDPETITILSEINPNLKIIVPKAEITEAIKRGAKADQIVPLDDTISTKITNEIKITGIAAAHETLKINNEGYHHFLGYIIELGGVKIYHSGDCIPYNGLHKKIEKFKVDLALLPINGRDSFRLNNGIAGNFKIPEVIELCVESNIHHLIVHHFGMFSYNNVSDEDLNRLANLEKPNLSIYIPNLLRSFKIIKTKK